MSWFSSIVDDALGDFAKPIDAAVGGLINASGLGTIGGGLGQTIDAFGAFIPGYTAGPRGGGVTAVNRTMSSGLAVPGGGGNQLVKTKHGTYMVWVDQSGRQHRQYVRRVKGTTNYQFARRPRMNPFNPCALRKALRRTESFAKFATRIIHTRHHFKPAARKGRFGRKK